MASASRQERQLMRQRAGLRDVDNVDFAIKFGSHGSREERQFMRTRGAGQRNIENVDFGFTFPTPGQNRRSASKTPQSRRRGASRSSKTPVSRSKNEPLSTQSTRRISIVTTRQSPIDEQLSRPDPEATYDDEEGPSKRRRIEDSRKSITRQSLRGRKASGATFSIAEEPVGSNQEVANNASAPESPLFFVDNDGDKENDNSIALDGSEKNTDVAPSAQKSTRRRTRSSMNELEENSVVPSIEENEELLINSDGIVSQGADLNKTTANVLEPSHGQGTQSQASAPKQMKRRRKRKTVVLGRKKRRSSGNDSIQSASVIQTEMVKEASTNVYDEESTASRIDDGTDEEEDSREVSHSLEPPIERPETLQQRQQRSHPRTRLSMSASPAPPQSEDEEDDGTYVYEEHTPDPTTPAPKRKTGNKRRSSDQGRSIAVKQRKTKSGASFPILTHRMTNFHMLPTILEERNSEQPSDDEGRPIPDLFKDRAVPNAVDVFAQICRETIEGAIDQLKPQPGSNRPRGEIASKRTAMEAFGKELDQRLFDMSEAVEYRLTLEARLRKSKRELADMQAQWIDLRRQRDELGLRADAIRRRNWENEEKARRQWEASRLAQQIELNLENEVPEQGLEFRLRAIGSDVSSFSGSCGLLDRVKSFNAQLERVAAILEGK